MQKWMDTRGGSPQYFQGQAIKKRSQSIGSLWSLVLAGGHGERLRQFTEQRFGV